MNNNKQLTKGNKMKNLLKTIANKPEPKLNMDSIQVGTVAGLSAFPIQ